MISILYIFLFSVILHSNVFLQTENNKTDDENWSQIDEHALNAPRAVEYRVQSLAEYFLEVVNSDSEKARVIYRWITDRISYDLDTFFKGDLKNIKGEEVLGTRKAVCSGYVVLFVELYAREINDDSGFFKLVTYYYLNNKSAETVKSYPKVMGFYENSRASLDRPLQYALTDTLAYDFEITIPGAEEAYLTNSTKEWCALERDGQHFYGTTTPGSGKILLVARFPGDDFYSVMVEFEGN